MYIQISQKGLFCFLPFDILLGEVYSVFSN